jgi:nitrite reductase/ring-hydroxylating ferredoxin subunit
VATASDALGHIDNDDPHRFADLRRGEAQAGGCVHRLQHVVHQATHARIDLDDGASLDQQARIGGHKNASQCHAP